MAGTAEKTTEAENVNPNGNVIEDMISNLKLDIEAREEHTEHLKNYESSRTTLENYEKSRTSRKPPKSRAFLKISNIPNIAN